MPRMITWCFICARCPEKRARVVFNDPRRFGFMLFAEAKELDRHPMLANLGIEPTGNALDGMLLADLMRGRKAPLKAALLDQTVIAGLGNIYVAEALWRAGLSPRRAAGTIAAAPGKATERSTRLATAIRNVVADAIHAGGSSLKDHIQTDGSLGYFQHSFSVYDREAELVRDPAAAAPSIASFRAGAPLSIARPASGELSDGSRSSPGRIAMTYETIIVETRGKVGLVTLNRPKALNALNSQVLGEIVAALQAFDANMEIGAIVITGSEKAFAAGADIKEMQAKTYVEAYLEDFFVGWEGLTRIRKPIIAAVCRLCARRRL